MALKPEVILFMKRSWKWLVPAVLALVMTLSMTCAFSEGAYGMTTTDEVIVRKQPSTDAARWFTLDEGFVCEILDVVVKGETTWYKVNSNNPNGLTANTYIGYIRGQYFRPLTDSEAAAYLSGNAPTVVTAAPAATMETAWQGTGVETVRPSTDNVFGGQFDVGIMTGATATPTVAPVVTPESGYDPGVEEETVYATGEVTASGTNFRLTPGMDGQLIGKLNAGAVVELLTIPEEIGENYWFRVRYNGQEGFIQSNYVRILTVGYTPKPAPSSYGYARLIYDSANLRDAPAGTTQAQWEGQGSMLQIVGPCEYKNSYYWYPVYFGVDSKTYYVREDVITLVDYPGSTGSSGSTGGSYATATPIPGAAETYGYVITTKAGVNLRIKPNGETMAQIPRNTVVGCIGLPVEPADSSYTWYFVEYRGMHGYLRGDCVRVCDENGGNIVATPTPAPTTAPSAPANGYVRLTKGGVNLRIRPAGTSQGLLPKDLILPVIGETVRSGSYTWYPVRTADGRTGYVRSDCLVTCDEAGNEVTGTPTPAPGTTNAPVLSEYGYVHITKAATNLRDSVAGSTLTQLQKETVWPLVGRPVTYSQYTWYPITANGYTGFVRGDCAFQLSPAQELAYLQGMQIPMETPVPTPVNSSYVQTILNAVNLRTAASQDAAAPYQVSKGTVMAYNSVKQVGTTTWYRVVYQGSELWVKGSCVKVMTLAEYDAWLGSAPAVTPQPSAQKGYLITVKGGVNIRNKANGATILERVDRGTILPYYADAVKAGNYFWYKVRTTAGEDGYIRSDMVDVCDQSGKPVPTVTPGTSGPTPAPGVKPEATYTTLRLGSTGTAVYNLVSELIKQGFYTGSPTSSYTSDVRAAVIAFQQAKGLQVDGIAGSQTQHALFGTVPPGTGNSSDLSFQFYPVEKIDWYTGGIQQLWPRGANYKIYDIKSGLVWWCHRWAGADHMDVEPLTAADTARLCQMYGVNDAQEIYDKNLWQRRPSLVTIGTRTFACSLDGMPHNPAGDTIDNNNMTGQICLHFTNSKGHESGQVSTSHKNAIQEAYDWAKQRYGAK